MVQGTPNSERRWVVSIILNIGVPFSPRKNFSKVSKPTSL
jgi:hypothetical protein